MESQDLDKLFRDAFEQAEETPNIRVWEGIEQELAQEKKVIPFYIKYRTQLSIAATFLLFFGVGLTFYQKPISSGKEKIEELLSQMEKQTEPTSNSKDNTFSENNKEKLAIEIPEQRVDNKQITENNIAMSEAIKSSTSVHAEQYTQPEIEDRITIQTSEMVSTMEVEMEATKPNYQEVNTITPLKDDRESTYVFTDQKEEVKSSLVTRVLNGITKNIISKNIDIREDKEIEFRNDEEGSLTLNIINSFARK